ncbi:hypothetical protein [Vibrio tubiashii]|uniref:hypothetical protein n=1 Tax=Vibrio tubiashii TaxID=29498 RepID=UPI00349E5E24
MIHNKSRNIGFLLALMMTSAFSIVVGVVVGVGLSDSFVFTNDSLAAWIASASTLAITLLTLVLALETWRLRQVQTNQIDELRKESIKPVISVKLAHNPVSYHLLDIQVNNLGRGVAKNISFRVYHPENDCGFSEGQNQLTDSLMQLSFMQEGIRSLAVGDLRKSYVYNFHEQDYENSDPFLFSFVVTATYFNVEGDKFEEDFIFDLSEYRNVLHIGGGEPLQQINKNLESIVKVFNSAVKQGRLRVNMYNSEDRNAEQKLIERRLEEFEKNRQS